MRSPSRSGVNPAASLLAALALTAAPAAGQSLAGRLGFYQWVGAYPRDDAASPLASAQRHAAAAGARVFRIYLGPRYDYERHPGLAPAPGATPAKLLSRPSYQALLNAPDFHTIILSTYTAADYGAGPDDLNLLRPWSAAAEEIEREQISGLCEYLYAEWGGRPVTVIIANSEADEKMLEIANYTGSPEQAVATMVQWTRTRHEAVRQVRERHPKARLRLLHGFEISLVNLALAQEGQRFGKSPSGTWNALRHVIPKIAFDVLLYSSYESVNSPYETQNTNVDPAQTGVRLRRDLDRIRDQSRASLSEMGRKLYRDRFVAIGELGLARERYEHLPTGGVAPRLVSAIEAAAAWGSPYIILWQVFDAPRAGSEQYGFGMLDRDGRFPVLRPGPGGCDSVRACVAQLLGR
jgi:hypothetical protein